MQLFANILERIALFVSVQPEAGTRERGAGMQKAGLWTCVIWSMCTLLLSRRMKRMRLLTGSVGTGKAMNYGILRQENRKDGRDSCKLETARRKWEKDEGK